MDFPLHYDRDEFLQAIDDSVSQWLASWLVVHECKGSTLIAAELQLPSEAWRFEQLTTVIPVTLRSWADCLLTVVVTRPTQPSIPPGSVNEDQLRLAEQRQVWLIQSVDKHVGMQVEPWNPSTTRAIPERFCSEVRSLGGAIPSVWPLPFHL